MVQQHQNTKLLQNRQPALLDLLFEVIDNGFKYDLCLLCNENDE